MKPADYQEQALKTVNPGLDAHERLGMCGLGLSGEVGEVTDMLKKYLYHRNGKPLDIDKMRDELGDVTWYMAILLHDLGLTFEEVMQANADKLAKRHGAGFVARYTSDSNTSA